MKILSITAGAANMYCGSCLRDNALAAELKRQGHDVVLLPLYTPTKTDEPNVSEGRVFFGGISIYLEQSIPAFRRTPKFLDKLWDLPGVISLFAGRGVEVAPGTLGALTVSMLEGMDGNQRKEIDNLVGWLAHESAPDVVTLPYTLLLSLARPLKQATGRPLVCTMQGEELFIEGLPEPYRSLALELIRGYVKEVDAFIAVSGYGAKHMAEYLRIPGEKIHTVPLGVDLQGYSLERRTKSETANVGFFGRITPEKGLHTLVEAYGLLRKMDGCPKTRLHVGGYMAPEKKPYLAEVRARLKALGLEGELRHWGEVDRETKARFYQNLDVFSMPAAYEEPKGLSVLEAMANGVPVVLPRRGSFVEMVENTGGGILVERDNPEALAAALYKILTEPAAALRMGRNGCEAVRKDYSIERMAEGTLAVYELARTGERSAAVR